MLKLVKDIFRNRLELLLWLNLAVCAIAGALIGRVISVTWQNLAGFDQFMSQTVPAISEGDWAAVGRGMFFARPGMGLDGLIIGAIAGCAVGFIVNIIAGGYFSTVIEMHKNLEQLRLIETAMLKKASAGATHTGVPPAGILQAGNAARRPPVPGRPGL
jgi:hypothetical protein